MNRTVQCPAVVLASALSAIASIAAPPVVTRVQPAQGFVDEATPITVQGSGFEPQAKFALLPGGYSRVFTPGDASDVAVAGHHAYVAAQEGGLAVVDIGDPLAPVLVGPVYLPRYPQIVSASGTKIYVAGYYSVDPDTGHEIASGWLGILDVSEPAAPVLVGSFEIGPDRYPWDIAVSGDHVYVAERYFGLEIFDVSDPAAPSRVSSFDTGMETRAVAVSRGYAFVMVGSEGMKVLDVSDPTTPSLVSTYDTRPLDATHVALSGNSAFLACNDEHDAEGYGLLVVDVTDPALPWLRGSVTALGTAADIALTRDTAYVANRYTGLNVIDVSDPRAPALAGRCDTPGSGAAVATAGNQVLVASGREGLQITSGACPDLGVGELGIHHNAHDVEVSGQYAFVTQWSNWLYVVDVGDPSAPVLVGESPLGGAEGVAVVGQRAFLTGSYGLRGLFQIVDVGDPSAPTRLGAVGLPGGGYDVVVSGTHAFVAAGSAGLQVIDVGDPVAPAWVGGYATERAVDVALSGMYALVADSAAGLKIIDISAPDAPALVGACGTPGSAEGVAVLGAYAAVADGWNGLQLVDIGDPAHPVLAGHLDTPASANAVAVSGHHVFVVHGAGLSIVDASDPSAPSLVTVDGTSREANAIALFGEFAITIGGPSGLQILRPNPPLRDVGAISSEAMAAIVPSGFAPGPYHVRATNREPEAAILADAFLACARWAMEARLAPWLPPIPRSTPAPVERRPVTWRLEVDGDAALICPRPQHEADLLLPLLPARLELQHGPATEPGTIQIELLIVPGQDRGSVRLLADDAAQADALWTRISSVGRIEVPRDDARHYADLALSLSNAAPGGVALIPESAEPSPGAGAGPVTRGTRPPRSGAQLRAATYAYRFGGGELTGASAAGSGADLVFEVVGTDRFGCKTLARVSFAETGGGGRSWVVGEDLDGDGIGDFSDNCPVASNPDQGDGDGDGWGDACDACPADRDPDQVDADHDGVGDACDDCPSVMDACQTDRDGDAAGDACDDCPRIANAGQEDADGDRLGDACDNCAAVANVDQQDADFDRLGDACDTCTDRDRDGFGDPGFSASTCAPDNCPAAKNSDQADRIHPNGIGDACDDPDGDGAPDAHDNCADLANPDQRDADGDELGDPCDSCTDRDHDGWGDPDYPATTCPLDNCPDQSNASQADADGDGPGDACDACTDTDGDGYGDPGLPASLCAEDNCPSMANADQEDRDGDRRGDVCDALPDDDLIVLPEAPKYALTGDVVTATYRLLYRTTGQPASGLAGVRTTLTLSGSARFGESAGEGLLLEGGGTQRALVEFVEGPVSLDVTDTAEDVVPLAGQDTESNGVVVLADVEEDFESGRGGFTHAGTNDPWQWGEPTSGPERAASGTKLWATNLAGSYPNDCRAGLSSRDYWIPAGSHPVLAFQDWFSGNWTGSDLGRVELSPDGGAHWAVLEQFQGYRGEYTWREYDLSAWSGRAVRIRFWLGTDGAGTASGWYLDDFSLRGIGATIDFLAPDGDADADGLGNAAELAAGLDPRSGDTDGDAQPDATDNCPKAVNPDQSDRIHPNGIGDACDDPDGDGRPDADDNCVDVANPEQQDADRDAAGDPCDACTDGDDDGFGDPGFPASTCPLDNCPAAWNPDQADAVHPNGIGDACDDPDADGVPDLVDDCPDHADPSQRDGDGDGRADACDNCPDHSNPGQSDSDADAAGDACDNCAGVSNPGQEDRDGDRLGDLCDPYPDRALLVIPVAPAYGATDAPAGVLYRLEWQDTGELATDLAGVRTTLTLGGSAVFGESATAGLLLEGGGTPRALVEFVAGLVTLPVQDSVAEVVLFAGEDTERNGVRVRVDVAEDFESDGGGLTHQGTADPWEWGEPTSGPGEAHSGRRVWATNLSGNYPTDCSAVLQTPPYRLAAGTQPRLEYWDWFQSEYGFDLGRVQISADGGATWDTLELLQGPLGGYTHRSHDLSSYAGAEVRIRFWMISDVSASYAGWYIDDLVVRGVPERTEFLTREGDEDADGLTNAAELAAGLDPRDPDTDDDGALDGADNCPAVSNAAQKDRDGDGRGNVCDNCPETPNPDQADSDGDGVGDACEA